MAARTTPPATPASTDPTPVVEDLSATTPLARLTEIFGDVSARIIEEHNGLEVTVTFAGDVDTDVVIALQARCRAAGFACSGVQIIAASTAYWRAQPAAPSNTDDQEV